MASLHPARQIFAAFLALTVAALVFCHVFRLASVPRGFYVDEASLGLHAMALAETGRDAHGDPLPLYIRSYEAWHHVLNPVYVYAAAAICALAGPSEFNLRLTSALFFLLAAALFWRLLRRLFPDSPTVCLFGLVAFGFMPHYFYISRVSFDVISELPLLVAVLVAVHLTFETVSAGRRAGPAAVGLLLGLSTYAYTTNRVFSPLVLAAIVVVYYRRDRRPQLGWMVGVFALTLVPLGVFVLAHPGALTARFEDVSWINDGRFVGLEKPKAFASFYLAHFSPRFLLINGDGHLRHTFHRGVLFWTVLPLAVAGVVFILTSSVLRQTRFLRLVLVLVVLAPAPAALTVAPSGHVLRSLPLSMFVLIIACVGLQSLVSLARGRGNLVAALALAGVTAEASGLVWEYFVKYPAKSAEAFWSDGLPELLEAAYARHPQVIYYSDDPANPNNRTYFDFYRKVRHLPETPPLQIMGDVAGPHTCTITLANIKKPPPTPTAEVTQIFHRDNPTQRVHLTCYD